MASSKNKAISLDIDARNNIVRLDMALGLARIAKPLRAGAKRGSFDISQDWDGGTVRFVGVELDDHDLGVLLALISIAQKKRPAMTAGNIVAELIPFVPGKKGGNLAADLDVVTVDANFKEVRDEIGVKTDSSHVNDVIRNSLVRLASIVVEGRKDDLWGITHLIKNSNSEKESLRVTLSFRLTKALLGNASYGAVDMNVFSKLPRGAARILYVWLVSWFGGAQKARVVGLNKLVENIFNEPAIKMSASALKDRRRTIKHAMGRIQALSNLSFTADMGNAENIIVVRD